MGILNVTPDSFSDGGKSSTVSNAVANSLKMIDEGADIIDIGGQSTAPNAPEITDQEEIDRVVPVIHAIRQANSTVPISIDTFRAQVAKAALEAGANLVNDVSGGTRDPEMLNVMSSHNAPVCLMHMRGNSSTMNGLTNYDGDLVEVLIQELSRVVSKALLNGVFRWNIMIDPGIGFAKNHEQNYQILKRLPELTTARRDSSLTNMPVLVGVSRKRFLGKTTNQPDAKARVLSTAAANAISLFQGAFVVRVHDVKENKDVCLVCDELLQPS